MAHTPKETKTSPQMSAAIADRVTSPRDTTQSFGRIGIPALAAAADDPAVRVVVLTGAGKAFCAGLDMAAQAGKGKSLGVLDELPLTENWARVPWEGPLNKAERLAPPVGLMTAAETTG